ncbi:hypothetical protein V502_05679 [Pseudogymnoascus sp. VKM F-4520 (FW-2644)]|nr:hypothetical protein V502_05679 [Pseudogymnoascus sp. VKM F-4520 (FW-2644)]
MPRFITFPLERSEVVAIGCPPLLSALARPSPLPIPPVAPFEHIVLLGGADEAEDIDCLALASGTSSPSHLPNTQKLQLNPGKYS